MISQGITDFDDNFDLGKVKFTPFLNAPNPNAMPNATTAIPEVIPSWVVLTMLAVSATAGAMAQKRKKQ